MGNFTPLKPPNFFFGREDIGKGLTGAIFVIFHIHCRNFGPASKIFYRIVGTATISVRRVGKAAHGDTIALERQQARKEIAYYPL